METFISIKPQSEILKKHIDSFYFHSADENEITKRIIFFPNLNNALTIYNNASLKIKSIEPTHVEVEKTTYPNFAFLYGGIQHSYVVSEMHTPFDKIGIIFKPLGINHFTNCENLGRILKKNYSFPYFEQSMHNTIIKLFNCSILEERIKLLEDFFLESFKEDFKELIIEKAIKIIENSNDKISVKDIAKQIHVSERTLNRKFQNHLNCSTKHYMKVFLFRKSLNQFYNKNKKIKLIDLALNNFYYDQPDFTKNFKSLTGRNPKEMFCKINNLGNNIYWIK